MKVEVFKEISVSQLTVNEQRDRRASFINFVQSLTHSQTVGTEGQPALAHRPPQGPIIQTWALVLWEVPPAGCGQLLGPRTKGRQGLSQHLAGRISGREFAGVEFPACPGPSQPGQQRPDQPLISITATGAKCSSLVFICSQVSLLSL